MIVCWLLHFGLTFFERAHALDVVLPLRLEVLHPKSDNCVSQTLLCCEIYNFLFVVLHEDQKQDYSSLGIAANTFELL